MVSPPRALKVRAVVSRDDRRKEQQRRRLYVHSFLVIGGSTFGTFAACISFHPSQLDLALLIGLFTVSGLGISVGYHRLLAHRSFEATPALRYALLAMGATAGQGPPGYWALLHRAHHRCSDKNGDPHSPFSGFSGRPLRGFAHAHIGWIHEVGMPKGGEESKDLYSDQSVKWIGRVYIPIVSASVLTPAGLGFWMDGSYYGAVTAALWGGAVRLFLVHHIVWSINSICHQFGKQPYKTGDQSRNVWWLSLVSFGEAWHNNHHAAAGSARFGIESCQPDLGYIFIRICQALQLARNVHVTPARTLLSRRTAVQ